MPDNRLNENGVQKAKALAWDKLEEYHKQKDVIGAQIFSIIENESYVLYYPLNDQQVWGFSETIHGKSFVCINTSLRFDKQVFAAAHELYHLLFGNSGEIMISKDEMEPYAEEQVELLANRFAAEFLVSEKLLRQEMCLFGISVNNVSVKDVVRLANHFVVPYHTMVKRLHEIGICSLEQYEKLYSYTDDQVEIWKNRLGITIPIRKEKIGLSNLVDRAMELYGRQLIAYEKLEHLLDLAGLSPSAMGVEIKASYTPPSDDELDAIWEE